MPARWRSSSPGSVYFKHFVAPSQPRHEHSIVHRRERLAGGSARTTFISTVLGDAVSWSVDTNGHVFPANGGAADEQYPHIVVDRQGIEWSVREVPTPQVWAKGLRCLVLNSRECVRRVWQYPRQWRMLDADALLRLGVRE